MPKNEKKGISFAFFSKMQKKKKVFAFFKQFIEKSDFNSYVMPHDALPNAFKKYDETTFQFCLRRLPSGVGHAAKISRKKSNSKLINFQRNLDDGCKNKIFKLLMWALNQLSSLKASILVDFFLISKKYGWFLKLLKRSTRWAYAQKASVDT